MSDLRGTVSHMRGQARAPRETAHRPWPLPRGPWLMGQTWTHLLFAHWAVPAEHLAALVPPELPVDRFEGRAWIGVVPFQLTSLRVRPLPPAPVGSHFPELNVRTYVTVDGRPGVYFFSLDAASPLAVAGARIAYRLPYFLARMSVTAREQRIEYRSRRVGAAGDEAQFSAAYGPGGPSFTALPGTLEHFLVERYCLYTVDGRRRVHRTEVHHAPWSLQPAWAAIDRNSMVAPLGLALEGEPLLHLAGRQDVVTWAPAPI